MSKSNALENAWLLLYFNGTPIANIADNAASAPLTNLYVALHSADPGEGGNQSTNEISYTGYARAAVARTAGGWTVAGNSVSPVADIAFALMTGGAGGTATYASIGSAASGAGMIGYSGSLASPIIITIGTPPVITRGSAITED